MAKKKMFFLYNPHAGKSQIKSKLADIINVFMRADYEIQVYATQKPEEAIDAVRQYAGGVDCLVVSGGDGTLNEAICGLMQLPREQRPVVGYLPAGTTNDFAYTHRLSKDMVAAAETVVNGVREVVDLGLFEDRYFTYVAGFGAFTDVPYKTPQEMKAILGHPAYLLEGMLSLGDLRPHTLRIELENDTLEGEFLLGLISNSERVAGFKGLHGKDVSINDGLLEVLLIRNPKNPADLSQTLTGLLQPDSQSPMVYRAKTRRIRLISEAALDWVLDGEFGGRKSEVTIEAVPSAVEILKNL
ncbi:MAG: YegS/Rv2252/BmrU family lipid kinase [Lachnospiraceae bacterium]|nr:YegS/Rv2252/BmrU family lipid kinase [Lachnospiraceae bacterium]